VIDAIHTETRTLRLVTDDRPGLLLALREALSGERLGSYLFESELDGRRVAVLAAAPLYTASIQRDRSELDGPHGRTSALSGIALLRALIDSYRTRLPGLAGVAQGVFTLVGYDAARQFERKLGQTVRSQLPDIWAMIPRIALAIDLHSGEAVLVRNRSGGSARPSELDALERVLRRVAPTTSDEQPERAVTLRPRTQTSREQYCAAVARAREYIMAGDIFQVVLSVETVCEVEARPLTLFRRMAAVNRQTANFVIEAPGFAVVGASPEILVEKRGRECVIRPLAGTLAHQGVRDARLEAQLLDDEKECAEHRMLVDLARNDLGRVCEYGSVRPDRLMAIEYFYNVMHISSEIRGRMRADCDALDLLTTSFPAGTMTGAPKIRAMEIIDELEGSARAFYAGGVGFLTPAGDLRSHIVIRSVTLHDGLAYSRAGAGIVYNSEPSREYDECVTKLQNAWRALTGASA
jgi:anthranilate synthase component 1